MKRIFFIILITIGVSVTTSCEKNEDQPIEVTHCFKIVDDHSDLPVSGADVRADIARHYVGSSGVFYFVLNETSDSAGNCCFKIQRAEVTSESIYNLFVEKKGYVYWGCAPPGVPSMIPSIIRLTPVAYIQMHIKNVPPKEDNDFISIKYIHPTCAGSNYIQLDGANVDTTQTVDTPPGNTYISWRSWHNEVSADSLLSGLSVTSRDTLFLEILY